jgi:ABC-type multidrug transport system fused ATPase/permease subunit
MLRTLRPVLALLTSRARGLQFMGALLRALELLAVFGTALGAARGDLRGTLPVLAAGSILFVLRNLLESWLTEETRRTFFNALASSLLKADLLAEPPSAGHDTEPLVFTGVFEAMRISTSILPALIGQLGASVILTGFIVTTYSTQVIASGMAALVVVSIILLAAHRFTRGSWNDEAQRLQEVVDGLVCAFRGRLELVASGREAEFVTRQRARTDAWSRRAHRGSAAAAFVWRGAWVAGALAGAGLFLAPLLGTEAQPALGDESWKTALVLLGSAPAFTSAARDAIELVRASSRLRPLVDVLQGGRKPVEGVASIAPPPLPAAIQFRSVSFAYPNGVGTAINHLDFQWTPGKLLIFAGPNGSGKSTVLRLLLGLGLPTDGIIEIGGVDLASLDLVAWRRQLAFVPQQVFLPEGFTVREMLRLTAPHATESAIVDALDRTELWEVLRKRSLDAPLDQLASSLSAGQRQRLWIARALAAETPILLMDEPDANLDPAGIELLLQIIRSDPKRAAIVATHGPELIAAGDKVIWLDRGSVAKTVSPSTPTK